ncbi:MAG: hypothetical protein IT285_12150, partial [Bdellovibrionales bacterium]|nr:hypothetical protein [Bdellovibrionales bacterium]
MDACTRTMATGTLLAPLAALLFGACQPQPGPNDDKAYVVFNLASHGEVIYGGGAFRNPENAAGNKVLGHEMLLILDASDPTLPLAIEARDVGIKKLVGVMGSKLVLFQDGYDEAGIDEPSPMTEQDYRVHVHSLSDPYDPQLEKTIVLPGTQGIDFPVATQLSDEYLLISISNPYADEDAGTNLTWVVRPNAASGTELVGAVERLCPAPVLQGSRIWCFPAHGAGTGAFRSIDIQSGGGLALGTDSPFTPIVAPGSATLLPGGEALVTDVSTGVHRVSLGASPALQLSADFPNNEVSASPAGSNLLVQTSRAIR